MSGETHAARVETPELGVLRWLSVHDDLLRGLTHALSNRLGTIAATAYLVELQPAAHESTAATLRAESERLDALLQLMRVLPRRASAAAEPVIPTDILQQAISIAAYHPEARELTADVTSEGDLQPGYVEPGHLAMALCVALGAAHRLSRPGAPIAVRISCTTDLVTLDCRAGTDDSTEAGARAIASERRDELLEADVAAVLWLLAPYGGFGSQLADGVRVEISTLQAARRAQRSAGARG